MRVISGIAKGRKLKSPQSARPLTDRVKEALFNILQGVVEGTKFLDLFAGCGQVGIEALSRGAELALFVENNRKNVAVIKENLEATGLAEKAKVFPGDAARAISSLASQGYFFDYIYLGAPYESPDLIKCLTKLGEVKLGKLIIAEHRKQQQLEKVYGQLQEIRQNQYGETTLTFYETSNISG